MEAKTSTFPPGSFPRESRSFRKLPPEPGSLPSAISIPAPQRIERDRVQAYFRAASRIIGAAHADPPAIIGIIRVAFDPQQAITCRNQPDAASAMTTRWTPADAASNRFISRLPAPMQRLTDHAVHGITALTSICPRQNCSLMWDEMRNLRLVNRQ